MKKPYTAVPACTQNACREGREPCKTEALCQITLPPIITKAGGMSIHRGIPGMEIEYVEPEPVPWYWKAIGAAAAVGALGYLVLGSHLIYLAWPL